jgi:hypothetical protein
LGGYATGTLTPEEQQALFAAALDDQELFDALGREQALRDLLRDPAAKAQLLASLDAPVAERAGFWRWLSRPLAAGLATACIAGIAGLAVWQGTRVKPAAPAPVLMAEVKAPEVKIPQLAPAIAGSPINEKAELPRREFGTARLAKDTAPGQRPAKSLPTAPPAASAALSAPPVPPAAAAPAAVPRSVSGNGAVAATSAADSAAQVAELTQKAMAGAVTDRVEPKLPLDARSLFYGNAFAPSANGQIPQIAGSGGAQSSAQGKLANAMRASNISKKENATFSLGVRVSLLRGEEEAAVNTVLNAGERVRLKVIPNEDGFLYVAAREGSVWKMVSSGPAQRLKPLETPALPFEGPGSKELYVMLSRQPRTLAPEAIAALVRVNLVETMAEQDRATYVVAGPQGNLSQQVVQPITLTYR